MRLGQEKEQRIYRRNYPVFALVLFLIQKHKLKFNWVITIHLRQYVVNRISNFDLVLLMVRSTDGNVAIVLGYFH